MAGNQRPEEAPDRDKYTDLLRNNFLTPLDLNTAIRTEEVNVQFENNSQANTDLRNVRVGSGSISFSNGVFELSTSATGSDAQAIETANIGEYSAGLPAGVGLEIEKNSNPTGLAEWGYGGDAFNDGLYWRLKSDGSYEFVREKGGTETTIPQSDWDSQTDQKTVQDSGSNDVGKITGLDKLDGSGQSGIDISTPVIGLFGFDFVLYGGGGFAPWHVSLTDDNGVNKTYPFVFNPTTENILEQFNQPVFGKIDNDGTATSDTLRVTERQFTVYGESQSPERGTQHVFDLTKTADSPTCLVGLRRANAGGGTRITILNTILSVDNDAHVWYLVDPDVTANGGDANWNQPQRDYGGSTANGSETVVEVNESLEVDSTTGVALDGNIITSAQTGNEVKAETATFRSSPFIRDRPVAVMLEPFAGASNTTSEEGVVNITEGF